VLPAGTVSAPSFAPTGDTNTGIFFPAADTIAFAEGGAEAMRIDSSGRVGINVTNPAQRLHISGFQLFENNNEIRFKDSGGTERTTIVLDSSNDLNIGTSANGNLRFINGATYTERMRIDSSGVLNVLMTGTETGVTNGFQFLSPSGTGGLTIYSSAATRDQIQLKDSVTTGPASGNTCAFGVSAGALYAKTGGSERMRITSSGNLLVGVTSGSFHTIQKTTAAAGDQVISIQGSSGFARGLEVYEGANSGAPNAANAVTKIGQMNTTGRSLNAAGTVNASGADYAEYMTKAGDFEVAKGDVVGINSEGKLTNVFADALSFCVKSTDPSYVGNDKWGCTFENDPEGLETARHCVDRIAFCGQVPVNVLGATPGQFIIPVNDNGAIAGQAVSSPTFEQYQIAVGKVIAIDDDGRARIIVKVA
jgi:hypothetical protein